MTGPNRMSPRSQLYDTVPPIIVSVNIPVEPLAIDGGGPQKRSIVTTQNGTDFIYYEMWHC